MKSSVAIIACLAALASASVESGHPDPAPAGYGQYISPIVVPARPISGDGGWSTAVAKARAFVNQLTVSELANLTTGAGILGRCISNTGTVPRLGFAGLCLEDSPLGVRATDFNSAFPAGINTAATWDSSLMHQRGVAMGAESRGKGVNVQLGPMINIGRAAAAGRNWEGFGSDPFLTGVAAYQTIQGMQSQGVIACAKHFIGNEQEHYRGGGSATASSSDIDDRTLHEVYAWPFAESVRAGVGSVMCSFNRINQTYSCENSKLLNGLLKEEMDFQGFVVSDYAAIESGISSIQAGADMDTPGFFSYGYESQSNPAISTDSFWGAALVQNVNKGAIPLARVQDMATRIMAAYYQMGQDEGYPNVSFSEQTLNTTLNGVVVNQHIHVQGNHSSLIREIGAASSILLKNTNHTLPLNAASFKHWGIFGSDAGPSPSGPNSCADQRCDQGTLAMGWGSGTVNFPYLVDPLSAIAAHVKSVNKHAAVVSNVNDYAYASIQLVAAKSQICLVFANADSGEGYITVEGNAGDRNNLTLWHSGEALINAVAAKCKRTVVVLHTVGPVIMESWVTNPNVVAVISAGLPGQESGNALVDVLFGAVNPSGRLPYTVAKARSDYSADVLYSSSQVVPQIVYSEKLLVDYRWFDAMNIQPRYEFGFGLSYTTFAYSQLDIRSRTLMSRKSAADGVTTPSPGGPAWLYADAITVSFNLVNSGTVAGNEVSQLYLGFPPTAGEPPKVLRGFERTYLTKGQSTRVSITLSTKAISIWNVVSQAWEVPTGVFTAYVGQSSRTIVLTGTFIR